jgi:zinc D-Ala-D-Ala carboxypeptidase
MPSEVPPGYLTPNFSLAEMIASDTADECGINNSPNDDEIANLTDLCELLELVRARCGGNPVLVSSGYRCADLNEATGGADNSAHVFGCAADFTIPAFGSPLDICLAIEPYMAEWGVDQLIHEYESWVHIGRAVPPAAPRCQCLTINDYGTTTGFA